MSHQLRLLPPDLGPFLAPPAFDVRPWWGSPDREVSFARQLADLDVVNEERARRDLGAPLTSRTCIGLVVDLDERYVVDVRGLTVLLWAARVAKSNGQQVLVGSAPAIVRRMVEALRLQHELQMVVSLPDAVGLFARAGR